MLGAVPVAALAQTAAPAATATPTNQVSEVVVTAQFRTQNLQKTPLAITALTGKALDARGQVNVADIANEAPNVVLKPAPANRGPALEAYIRGVGQADFNPAESPGVGMYVDDVYFGTITGTNFELLDLDRIEVLRGPQGTLSGQNSIGGSIKLYSKKPTGQDDGYVSVGYGSFNQLQVHGSADMTLIPDQLFVRIAGVSDHQDGYVTSYDYACTHPGTTVPSHVLGPNCKLGEQGGTAVDAGRFSVRWTPTSRLEVNVNADYTNDHSEGSPLTLLYAGTPAGPGVAAGTNQKYETGGVSLGTATGSPFISYSPYGSYAQDTFSHSPYTDYATYCDPAPIDGTAPFCVPSESSVNGGGVSGVIDYKVTDHLAFKSITAYRDQIARFSLDGDGTPIGNSNNDNQVSHRQFSEEARLTGDVLDGSVHYTVGGFYLDEHTHYAGRQDLPQFDFFENDQVPATTSAGFANLDWNATDKLELSGGVRYTYQEKTFNFGRQGVLGNDYNPVCTLPNGTTVTNNPAIPAAVCALNGSSGTYKQGHTDYRVAVQYQWTPQFMTYASIATGFKGGGVNPRPSSIYQEVPFAPETLTNYELGAKSEWFDQRLRLNGDVFYSNYDALQLGVSQCPMNPNYPNVPYSSYEFPCAALLNGGNAVLEGVELEGQARPVDGLSIDGSLSYLDFHFTSLTPGAKGSGLTLSSQIPLAPQWKYDIGAQYEFKLSGMGSLTPRLDLSYQSSFYSGAPNNAFNLVPGYTLLNGTVTWRAPDNKWSVALVVDNITNKLYYYAISDSRGATNTVVGEPAPPREWRVTVRRDF